jgi:hypothetical protein
MTNSIADVRIPDSKLAREVTERSETLNLRYCFTIPAVFIISGH